MNTLMRFPLNDSLLSLLEPSLSTTSRQGASQTLARIFTVAVVSCKGKTVNLSAAKDLAFFPASHEVLVAAATCGSLTMTSCSRYQQ